MQRLFQYMSYFNGKLIWQFFLYGSLKQIIFLLQTANSYLITKIKDVIILE